MATKEIPYGLSDYARLALENYYYVDTLSHAAGILMGIIVGTIFLVKGYQSGNFWAVFGIWLYLFGMLGSYVSSTLYHALKYHNPWKKRLRNWDHAAIYWHIAGS